MQGSILPADKRKKLINFKFPPHQVEEFKINLKKLNKLAGTNLTFADLILASFDSFALKVETKVKEIETQTSLKNS